jgi:hypothetical protein
MSGPYSLVRGGGWTAASTILNSELSTLDAHLASLINGDDGGCYALGSATTIAGSGLQVTGPVVIARGGNLKTGSSSPLLSNVPLYSSPRTRTFVHPCAMGRPSDRFMWRARRADGSMQSVAQSYVHWANGVQPAVLTVPLRCHQGATLSSVTVNYRVGWPHATLPKKMPALRITRCDAGGNVVAMTSQAAGADVAGLVYAAKPATAAAWSGAQSITAVCDTANVIDRSNYTYWAEIVEEQGLTGYPWQLVVKQPVRLAGAANPLFSTFSQGQPYSAGASGGGGGGLNVDNVQTVVGDRILLTGIGWADGIWVASAGTWARSTDLQDPSGFAQGMVVPVTNGDTNGGSYLQSLSATTAWVNGPSTYMWASGFSYYAAGVLIQPSAANATGYYYIALSILGTGTTGGTEPAWPTSIGQTVIDNRGSNQIVWQCAGLANTATTWVARPDSDVGVEGADFVAHGNIWQAVTPLFTNVTSAAWQ